MLFIVIAKDGTDAEALNRRLTARAQHIALSDEAIQRGEQLLGCAILNDSDQMAGSVMLVDFESREKLGEWLEKEPYVTGNVWDTIDVYPCKIGPSFENSLNRAEK